MNSGPPYMDMHPQSHISSGPSSYAQPASHYQYSQQPPMPSSAHYGTPSSTYANYGYNNVTSPQSAGPHMQSNLPLPAMISSSNHQSYGPAPGAPTNHYTSQEPFDPTGQIAPPGMKPRVTATLWEDEGSLCFQVEAKGVCVARREDNGFINGTKLLNVAGMTRGRRDGILKSEKTRHVVKIGPMHLKGVWIPFERALEFANKEKITGILYPLFVQHIGSLLYNPDNASRTSQVVNANEARRRLDSTDSGRPPQSAGAPPLHHHHSMQASVGAPVPSTPHGLTTPTSNTRPGLDRAHTFPTPPTSASSVIGMGSSNGSYGEWSQQSMPHGVHASQPLSIDTAGGMNNTRSMPTTPATTPPGQTVPQMQPYSGNQPYEGKPNYYATTPSSQTGYAQQGGGRYEYKQEMGPPTAPNTGNNDSSLNEHKSEFKTEFGGPHHSSESNEPQENGYMPNGGYPPSRPEYGYSASSGHSQLSPEMTSPHHNASGRGTPRTMQPGQSSWGTEYRTPIQGNNGSMYSSHGDSRAPNGAGYPPSAYQPSLKRRRDDDDQDARPVSRETYQTGYDSKRQKMNDPSPFGMPLHAASMQAIKTGGPISSR